MYQKEVEETRCLWNKLADDWLIQVGDEGDRNRILNSDPVLWEFAGMVDGLKVIDAGCGTGYLANKLHQLGAKVIGVDFSIRMLEIAGSRYPNIDFRLDDCCQLSTVSDEEFDLLISNYVLMDMPDLDGAVDSFYRVLKPKGVAIIVFSHPCFDVGNSESLEGGTRRTFTWELPYFEIGRRVDKPWSHFTDEFIWFHRPLSDYFKSFKRSGFLLEDFEEPRIREDKYHLVEDERKLNQLSSWPYSVVFKLNKT